MKVELNRQLIGLEDIVFGVGTVEQTRGGETVEITKINTANLPFDEVKTLSEVLDELVPKMDYTKDILEPKMDYTKDTLEDKMDSVIANEADIQNAAENAILARRYANEAEDVEVETGLYSAKHWSEKASIAAEQVLSEKVDKSIINTTTVGAGILVGQPRVEWTKGFNAFTGAILIELTGLYNEAAMVGRMKVVINQAVGDDRIFYIDGRWLNTTHAWDEANVIETTTANTRLNVRFAKDTVNSKVYLVIGETTSTWNALRIMIDEVVTNYNSTLNLGFAITSTTNISGLTTDYTKLDKSLATVGTAGTYRSVTTDVYGRVTEGTNPTTVAGYGLTDVYTKTQVDTNIGTVAEFNAVINF